MKTFATSILILFISLQSQANPSRRIDCQFYNSNQSLVIRIFKAEIQPSPDPYTKGESYFQNVVYGCSVPNYEWNRRIPFLKEPQRESSITLARTHIERLDKVNYGIEVDPKYYLYKNHQRFGAVFTEQQGFNQESFKGFCVFLPGSAKDGEEDSV